jgi:PAS domain S-box-containing protein
MIKNNLLIITDKNKFIIESMTHDTFVNIKTTNTLTEAFIHLKETVFDLIITELSLPDSKGINTLVDINGLSSHSPIIALLDGNDKNFELELELIRYGADDILYADNINSELLLKTISHSIERANYKERIAKEKINLLKIIENIKDAIVVIDDNKRVLFHNNSAETILDNSNLFNSQFTLPFSKDENVEYQFNNGKNEFYLDINAVNIEWNGAPAFFIYLRNITKKKKIEREMIKSAKILKTIFDSIQTGLALIDIETGKIEDINPALENMLGYQKETLIGKYYYEHICSQNDCKENEIKNISNKINKMETIIRNNEGHESPVILINVLMDINDKKYMLMNIMDISDQKSYENLLENNLKYERFISRITTMFYQFDEPENILKKFIVELGALAQSEHIGFATFEEKSKILEWWNDDNEHQSIELKKDTVKQNITISTPLIIRFDDEMKKNYCINGNIEILSSVLFPVFIENKPYGYFSIDNIRKNKDPDLFEIDFFSTLTQIISMGLTKIYSMEKIKDNYSLLNIMIHTIPEPIFYMDQKGKYLGCNDIFANRLIGIPEENIIGKTIIEIMENISHDQHDFIRAIYEKEMGVLNNGKSIVEEIKIMNTDGIERSYIIYDTAFRSSIGEIAGLVGVMIDITEKNRKDAEKEEMRKHLIETEKLSEIGQLSAGIAHEFNNILAIIKSSVQLMNMKNNLKELSLPDEVIKEFRSIEDNVRKASDIVSNMMKLSKPMDIKREYYSITDIIDEVLKVQKKQFEIENIKIEKKYEQVPDVLIDTGQMYQVFLNLSINARHAMKKNGGGMITVTVKKNENQVVILFMDNGTGIKEEIKDKIFLPFFSTKGAHSKDDQEIKGTGLGLSVTKNIIINHNGSIEIESEDGKGAVFIIKLPLQTAINSNNSVIIKDIEEKRKRRYDSEINIAIVDDEKKLAETTKNILILYGYRNIHTFNSGKELLDSFQENKYDLVLMDFFMPGLNGDEILENLMLIDNKIKVIYITGNTEGLNGYLTDNIIGIIKKPFDNKFLVNKIDAASISNYRGE